MLIRCVYAGGRFTVDPRFQRRVAAELIEGETYEFEPSLPRSQASHDQFFAWLADAFQSLPERYQFETWAQSEEHLRKRALIMTGFCTCEQYVASSIRQASEFAAFMKAQDEYCVVKIDGKVISRFRAVSQKRALMGAKQFQRSKQAVMDYVQSLLDGTPPPPRQEMT